MLALPTAKPESYGMSKKRKRHAIAGKAVNRQVRGGIPPRRCIGIEQGLMRGFKNFLMRGDVIVVAVGLVVALAFSALIGAFTTYIINPIVRPQPAERQRPGLLGQ